MASCFPLKGIKLRKFSELYINAGSLISEAKYYNSFSISGMAL